MGFWFCFVISGVCARFYTCHQRSKWSAGAGLGSKSEAAATGEEEEEEEEVDGMQRDAFDEPQGQLRGGLGGIGLGGTKQQKQQQQQQQQYTGVDPDVAKNLKNLLPGNIKIFKMLEKMGFKNRLGKNEDGLATALAPTMLDAGSGLGYNQKNVQNAKEAKRKNDAAKATKAADEPARRKDSTGWMKVRRAALPQRDSADNVHRARRRLRSSTSLPKSGRKMLPPRAAVAAAAALYLTCAAPTRAFFRRSRLSAHAPASATGSCCNTPACRVCSSHVLLSCAANWRPSTTAPSPS
jgi:hypothetical protein